MNPFAQLDDHFARQFGGLPEIDPPVPRQRHAMDDLIDKMVGTLPNAGTLNTIYRVSLLGGEVKAECIPESEWRLPDVDPPIAPGLEVTEHRMDGLLLGNADIAINNRESVEGICVEDEDEGQ